MPIYAYRCAACGHSRDVLQKMSDPQLTVCPVCGAEQFQKQLTAAGFQLKGSGWYVTDFRGGSGGGAAAPASTAGSSPAPAPASDGGGASSGGESSGGGGSTSASSSSSTSCGGSCACH